jgi:hypothetical protein
MIHEYQKLLFFCLVEVTLFFCHTQIIIHLFTLQKLLFFTYILYLFLLYKFQSPYICLQYRNLFIYLFMSEKLFYFVFTLIEI